MKTKNSISSIKRILLYGMAVWLIPFVLSLPFFGRDGHLRVDLFTFKTIMLVASYFAGSWLMVRFLEREDHSWIKRGILAGSTWMILNWLMDFLILLPLNGMTVTDYWIQIGLRYAGMPITGFFMGQLLFRKMPRSVSAVSDLSSVEKRDSQEALCTR